MKIDRLQLNRNNQYFNDKNVALEALNTTSANGVDGEIILARYGVFDVDGALTHIDTMFSLVYKNEDTTYWTIFDKEALAKLPTDYESVEFEQVGKYVFTSIQPGDSVDGAFKKVESNIESLMKAVIDNEKVIAAALTRLNTSAGFDNKGEYIVKEEDNILSSASTLAEADDLLSQAIKDISNEINNIVIIDCGEY